MQTENLRINQLSADAYEWYKAYLAAIDNKNLDAFGVLLAEECEMVQGNAETVKGKRAILAALGPYWESFGSLTHDLLNIYGTERAFVLEAWNHYVRLDGKKVSVRAVAFTDRNEAGLVQSFRFYTDASPVFAPEAG